MPLFVKLSNFKMGRFPEFSCQHAKFEKQFYTVSLYVSEDWSSRNILLYSHKTAALWTTIIVPFKNKQLSLIINMKISLQICRTYFTISKSYVPGELHFIINVVFLMWCPLCELNTVPITGNLVHGSPPFPPPQIVFFWYGYWLKVWTFWLVYKLSHNFPNDNELN